MLISLRQTQAKLLRVIPDLDATTLKAFESHGTLISNVYSKDFPAHEFDTIEGGRRWHLKIQLDDLAWKRRGFRVFFHPHLEDCWVVDTYWATAIYLMYPLSKSEIVRLAEEANYDVGAFFELARQHYLAQSRAAQTA